MNSLLITNNRVYTLVIFIFIINMAYSSNPKTCRDAHRPDMNETRILNEIGLKTTEYSINKYNTQGNKHGVWIEENEYYITVSHFNNGMKVGCETIYDRKKPDHIYYMISYKDNTIQNVIMYNDEGHIINVMGEFKSNSNSMNYPSDYNPGFYFPYISYSQEFDDKGLIKAEGYLLLGNEWEIDAERTGNWKIYDSDGSFVLENYSKQ